MLDITAELATFILVAGLIIPILLGCPLFYACGGSALILGLLTYGPGVPLIFYSQVIHIATNYILLALPLFVFMGLILERSGIAERLYEAFYLWMGGIRGGLGVITILIGTVLAACIGIVSASVIMLTLIALPSMLKHGYSKPLACGAVCGGSTLGILIPPSVMLVLYGPNAQLSVGKLFMAAFMPGFMLSALYMVYILIHAFLNPKVAPAIPAGESKVSFVRKTYLLITAAVPPALLILSVLGSIFMGIAAPTEAAAVGALASIILAAGYRTLSWNILKQSALETLRIVGVMAGIAFGAMLYVSIFLGLGGGQVITDIIMATPGGRWGVFFTIMFIVFLLGFIMDWIGIVFIMIPIISPIILLVGFNPLWFAMMVIINFQTSFLTPPFAPTLFVLQSILKPEWGIDYPIMMKGVLPFLTAIIVCLVLCAKFPQIILWLPSLMIK